MNSRSRLKLALNHEQPDRIPLDLGATGTSGMHVKNVYELREYFGLEKRLVKVCEPYQMLGMMDQDLMDVLEIDTEALPSEATMLGFKNTTWKPWTMDIGLEVLMSSDFEYDRLADGSILSYPEGDRSVEPSAQMPKKGYFFDTIVRQKPIDESNLNPEDNLEEFKPVSLESLRY